MREVAFIKQNKEKWLEFELAIFGKAKKNPDELANLYIQMMNDLSYAQTYYPKSKTVIYLNHLASQIYQKIYKTKREEQNSKTPMHGCNLLGENRQCCATIISRRHCADCLIRENVASVNKPRGMRERSLVHGVGSASNSSMRLRMSFSPS